MSKPEVVSFGPETWAEGTRGTLSPHATSKPGIINARVYGNGSLGPRPVWTEIAEFDVSSLDGGMTVHETTLWFFERDAVPAEWYFEVYNFTGTRLYRGAVTKSSPPLSGTVWHPNVVFNGSILWGAYWVTKNTGGSVTVWPDGFSGVAMTVVDIRTPLKATFEPSASIFDIRGSVIHQGRAFFWGPMLQTVPGGFSGNANRIYYSDPYAYGTFTASAQYFDVDGIVAGMVSLGSNLFIWTKEGEWFVLQGRGNPADATLNALGPGRVPCTGKTVARIDNNGVFLSSDRSTVVSMSPDGQMDDMTLQHLGQEPYVLPSVDSGDMPQTAITDSFANTIIVPTNEAIANNYNGVWTEEYWNIAGFDPTEGRHRFAVVSDYRSGVEVALTKISSAAATQVYSRPIMEEFPHAVSAAEDPNSTLRLPRITQPTQDVYVKQVVIDARTFAPDPVPELTVYVHDGDNETYEFVTGPKVPALDEVTNVDGQFHQFTATYGTLPGTAFSDVEIVFKGMFIERVYVEVEIEEGRQVL